MNSQNNLESLKEVIWNPVLQRISISAPDHFGELHRVTLQRHQALYTLPVGETKPYFSFEGLARKVTEAYVSDSAAVRHTSVANKWKTIHLLLHSGHNATQIQYNLTFQGEGDAEFAMSFTVAVDTREVPQTNKSQPLSKDDGENPKPTPTPEPSFPFSEVPEDRRGPKIQKKLSDRLELAVDVPLVNISLLPAAVQNELHQLEEKLVIGDITVKGYNVSKAELLKPYVAPAGKKPIVRAEQVRESGPKDQRSLYKSQKEAAMQADPQEEGRAEEIILTGDSNEKKSRRDDTKPLLPIRIDEDKKEVVTLKQPPKLLNGISKPRTVQQTGGAPVGRKLQHFITSDRGFLPWERRKYFQEVLEVSRGAHPFACLFFRKGLLVLISGSLCRTRSACCELCLTTQTAVPLAAGCRTPLPTRCATSTSCSTASLDSLPARCRRTCPT